MASTVFPAASAGKTQFRTTLTSGTSYTVPAGVTYLNVTLRGGGGGGGGGESAGMLAGVGAGGAVISSTLSVTAGASIAYAIGAGGVGGHVTNGTNGQTGGTTTFTGATSASGGVGGATTGVGYAPGASLPNAQNNGGNASFRTSSGDVNGGTGGTGSIDIEYWV
jgi:hypothetical protein